MITSMIQRVRAVLHRQVHITLFRFVSCISKSSSTLLAVLLLTLPVISQEDTLQEKSDATEAAQEDSLSESVGMEAIRLDTLSNETQTESVKVDTLSGKSETEAAQIDSLTEKTDAELVQEDSLSKETTIEKVQKDSVQEKAGTGTARKDTDKKKVDTQESKLVNFALKNRRVRPYGWGEYRVGGTCLCCDNKNDGDCIVVWNIERTNRLRISQLVDGKIEGDTSNSKTYFGNVMQRELPKPVTTLMVDISLGKVYEVKKVIVYSIINKKKRTNYLSNCELGYYDQFNRLQWTGKVTSKKFDEPIEFNMKKPVLTKKIMLRIKGGKNRITEVAIFSKRKTE